MAFYWDRVDAWYEEDEQIFQHARDPYTRVDCLNSSRHVEVLVNGVKVADTSNPVLLFETGHNPRYYVPSIDVDMSALEPTDTSTMCPYKGPARYWTVTAGEESFTDYVWQVSATGSLQNRRPPVLLRREGRGPGNRGWGAGLGYVLFRV